MIVLTENEVVQLDIEVHDVLAVQITDGFKQTGDDLNDIQIK